MSQEKKFMLAVAGAAALGAAFYAASAPTRPADTSTNKGPDNKARDKKDMGLVGAGIGNTGTAGGTERAIDPSQDRKVQTTAASRDELPSGGVGGGVGAGGTSARAVELPMPKFSGAAGMKPSTR